MSKLFAKAGVKNALQHDVVVGLAEKEKDTGYRRKPRKSETCRPSSKIFVKIRNKVLAKIHDMLSLFFYCNLLLNNDK